MYQASFYDIILSGQESKIASSHAFSKYMHTVRQQVPEPIKASGSPFYSARDTLEAIVSCGIPPEVTEAFFLKLLSTSRSKVIPSKLTDTPELSAAVPIGPSIWDFPYSEWLFEPEDPAFAAFVGQNFMTYLKAAKLKEFYDTEYDRASEDEKFITNVEGNAEHHPVVNTKYPMWSSLPAIHRCLVLGTWIFRKYSPKVVRNPFDWADKKPYRPHLDKSALKDTAKSIAMAKLFGRAA